MKSLTFFRTHKKKQPHFIGEGGGLVVKSFGSQPTSHISYPRENFGENHQLKKKSGSSLGDWACFCGKGIFFEETVLVFRVRLMEIDSKSCF